MMVDWNDNAKAAVKEFAHYIGQSDKCERYMEAFATKKTVVDAVNTLGVDVLTIKNWNHVLFLKHVGAFHISAGDPNIINTNDTEFVCHRGEFETYVDSLQNGKKTIVDAVEQEGERWTHIDAFGDPCRLLIEEKDNSGYVVILRQSGVYAIPALSSLKPIKPTISEAEAELIRKACENFSIPTQMANQYISETYDVTN